MFCPWVYILASRNTYALHFIVIFEIQVDVLGLKLSDLHFVWLYKTAKARLACEVSFACDTERYRGTLVCMPE